MPRIAPIAPANMPAELRELLATRPPYAIYRTLANAPTVLPGFIQMASALLTKTELDPALRELVILRVGAHCRSAYEIHQHLRLARKVGLDEARIEKALSLDSAPGLAAREASALSDQDDLALAFTDSVVVDVKAPKPLFDVVLAWLGPRGVTELLMTIGLYMMVSRALENLEVEIETEGVDIDSKAYYPPVRS
jgi:4-carboxymuconolactone decarboxylase